MSKTTKEPIFNPNKILNQLNSYNQLILIRLVFKVLTQKSIWLVISKYIRCRWSFLVKKDLFIFEKIKHLIKVSTKLSSSEFAILFGLDPSFDPFSKTRLKQILDEVGFQKRKILCQVVMLEKLKFKDLAIDSNLLDSSENKLVIKPVEISGRSVGVRFVDYINLDTQKLQERVVSAILDIASKTPTKGVIIQPFIPSTGEIRFLISKMIPIVF